MFISFAKKITRRIKCQAPDFYLQADGLENSSTKKLKQNTHARRKQSGGTVDLHSRHGPPGNHTRARFFPSGEGQHEGVDGLGMCVTWNSDKYSTGKTWLALPPTTPTSPQVGCYNAMAPSRAANFGMAGSVLTMWQVLILGLRGRGGDGALAWHANVPGFEGHFFQQKNHRD